MLAWTRACNPWQALLTELDGGLGCATSGLCACIGRPIPGGALTIPLSLLAAALCFRTLRSGLHNSRLVSGACAVGMCLTLLTMARAHGGSQQSTCAILDTVNVLTGTRCCARQLRMSQDESSAWARHVLSRDKPTLYLEWGSGGSTEAAALRALAAHVGPGMPRLQVVSIDSSAAWASSLRADSVGIRDAESEGLLTFLTAGVGPTGAWGHPVDWAKQNSTTRRAAGRNYVDMHQLRGMRFDVVMVDGRFRLACALHARKLLKANGKLLVHDYSRYKTALRRWYVEVERAGEMGVLKPLAKVEPAGSIHTDASLLEDDSRRSR